MSNILIVEDEDAIRRVLKKVLSEENPKYKLDEAPDGEKAISLIKTQHYDLVLCDIKMPKKDGIEVLEFVSSYDSSIPIIMISGHGDLKTAVKAMRMGAYDYIEKPPDLNNLLNSVRSALVKTKTKKIPKKLKRLIPNMKLLGSQNKLKALRV
jgi:DNA-binding NtrC family response regulator